MEIRKANLNDLEKIENLSRQYDFEKNRDWKDLISSKGKTLFVLTDNNEIIGFSGIIQFHWNNTAQISNIFIAPSHRRRGLAVKLIQQDIDEARKISARCLIAEAPSLSPVKKLYEKIGFRQCGYNDRYYSNNGEEMCIWMSLDL
ncbi:MAG: GNAT family N-acetyltransferase [Candidatus Nanoarchaeia archaeon]